MSNSHKHRTAHSAPGKGETPPAAMGRRQRRAPETRVKLFRSALELIAERGLANVTVEDITEAADVGKGTFFNYFASKDHVLGVMAEIQLGKVHQAEAEAAAGKPSIRTLLRQLVHARGRARAQPAPGPRRHLLLSGERKRANYLETAHARRP